MNFTYLFINRDEGRLKSRIRETAPSGSVYFSLTYTVMCVRKHYLSFSFFIKKNCARREDSEHDGLFERFYFKSCRLKIDYTVYIVYTTILMKAFI